MKSHAVFLCVMMVLSVAFLCAPVQIRAALDCSTNFGSDSQSDLLVRLEQCQKEIAEQQTLVQQKQREATTLERDLDILNYKINSSKLQIKSREISIKQLSGDISTKAKEIISLEQKIVRLKESTAELLRKIADIEGKSLSEIVLSDDNISTVFADIDDFEYVGDELTKTMDEIRTTKAQTEQQKVQLEGKKDKELTLKSQLEIDKSKTESLSKQKDVLLKTTKGQEKTYKTILMQKQATLAAIKNKILKFVGGGELKFPEALALAKIPEKALGVRAALILAILTQESGTDGVIGKNLGRCYYNTPWNNKAGTVMSADQKIHFVQLMAEIGRDPNTTPVSCPIMSDGQYGGALGPAQFMPKTWWDYDKQTGYKARVGSITGNNPASPFTNLDAFTGTALYLRDGLSGCQAIYSSLSSQEACAAAKYYAGGNWKKHMNGYGKSVANRATAYQQDIDILDNQ